MRILVITWRNGENNPFAYFSHGLMRQLEKMSHRCREIFLDQSFEQQLEGARAWKPDIAIAWQGIGSNLQERETGANLWEVLQIPVFCWHSDHPSHMPSNHMADSVYVFHAYGSGAHRAFSDQYLPRVGSRSLFFSSSNFMEVTRATPRGNYFYFPKNLDDPVAISAQWKSLYTKPFCDFLELASDAIWQHYLSERKVPHGEVVSELISEEILSLAQDQLRLGSQRDAFFAVHSMLDLRYRNLISASMLECLSDIPIKIVGRGWDRFAARGNPNHEFSLPGEVAEMDFQFSSLYGVLDVAPGFDGLHDRSMRAAIARSSFLIASSWNRLGFLPQEHDFNFVNNVQRDLREKAEVAMSNPQDHRNRTENFRVSFESVFSHLKFAELLEACIERVSSRVLR